MSTIITSSKKTRSGHTKESIPLLTGALLNESWFQILFIGNLDQYNLGKTARLFAEFQTPAVFPRHLIPITFTLSQEWADQLGQNILVTAELCMGAPPMGLYRRSRANHHNRRKPSPIDFNASPTGDHALVQPMGFLPINCPFCPTFVPAGRYRIVHKDGVKIFKPFCYNHAKCVE